MAMSIEQRCCGHLVRIAEALLAHTKAVCSFSSSFSVSCAVSCGQRTCGLRSKKPCGTMSLVLPLIRQRNLNLQRYPIKKCLERQCPSLQPCDQYFYFRTTLHTLSHNNFRTLFFLLTLSFANSSFCIDLYWPENHRRKQSFFLYMYSPTFIFCSAKHIGEKSLFSLRNIKYDEGSKLYDSWLFIDCILIRYRIHTAS